MVFWLASIPANMLHRTVPPSSKLFGLADTLRNQTAFVEMQNRAVQVGGLASHAVASLFDEEEVAEKFRGARFHFIGHSFGGLVVNNCVRHLPRVLRGSQRQSLAVERNRGGNHCRLNPG